jgi:signal transduction histidine kinase
VHTLNVGLQYLNVAAFCSLAVVSVRLWRRRRGSAALWAMLAFTTLALVVVFGLVSPKHPAGFAELALQRVDLAVFLLFPYFLYRFTTGFDPPYGWAAQALRAMTVVMVVWTFAIRHYPETGESWSPLFAAYATGFLVHWALLSATSGWRLWRAGRGLPSVSRKRMRLLAVAAAALTVALFASVSAGDADSWLRASSQLLAFVTAVLFYLGLAPPQWLRIAWRAPESRRLQEAIASLMTLATTREEIVDRVLGPAADIVGARAVAMRDTEGAILGTHNVEPGALDRLNGDDVVELDVPGGSLVVWTTRYAPFFGDDEFDLLRSLGALAGLALDRVRLFMQEHETRLALERANETMNNFVALAAHELRTPITSIHGFVHTLNHLGHRLSEEQQREVRETLESQTIRMAMLVEQLLDLSRLDAEAVEISPERFRVRDKLADLVDAAAADRAEAVTVDVSAELEAEADPAAFDRIVTNLITNAFRYGEPPVLVRAGCSEHQFQVTVEDCGRGVPNEFVPDLFERFSRSETSRGRAGGTGLGLAIARSYARAHGGDLVYEPAHPSGARFKLVLPAEPAAPDARREASLVS